MTPLAHHAGEQSLAALLLLLLGGGSLSVVVAIGRAHLVAARARLRPPWWRRSPYRGTAWRVEWGKGGSSSLVTQGGRCAVTVR